MTEKPDYVLNFPRQKNTEIKKIGNNWYLYERFSKYDPAINLNFARASSILTKRLFL